MSLLRPPGIYFDVSQEEYRKDPGYNQLAIKAFSKANSPAHYRWDADHPTIQDKDFIRIGNFVDCAVFHPHKISEKFVVWPGERRGKEWTSFKEANEGKTILTEAEHVRALGAFNAIKADKYMSDTISASRRHVVVIATHPEFGYRLKAELDIVPPFEYEWLLDLKTAEDASRSTFKRQAFSVGYDVQACFYMDILSFLPEPVHIKKFGFMIAETNPPHGVKMRHFNRNSKEMIKARKKIDLWLPAYDECAANNKWPNYDSSSEEIVFDRWMLNDDDYAGEVLT